MTIKTCSSFALITCASLLITVLGVRSMLQQPSDTAAQSPLARPTPAHPEVHVDRIEAALAELRADRGKLMEESQETAQLLAALAERLDELEKQRAGAAALPSPQLAAEPAPVDPADAERAEAEERERAEGSLRVQFRRLDDAIAFEELDSGWSRNAELEIADAVAAAGEQGLSLAAAECRSTLCRIQVAVDPAAPEDEAIRALLDAAPWSGERFFRFEGGPDGSATLYLAREGARLPGAEDAAR